MKYGTVRITLPDGQVRDHPLDIPAARIGRSPENNIVIDHVTVSRRHARVSIDSGQCFIEDLGSDSGTFVGGSRLGPGERQIFGMAPVRLGDVEIAFMAPTPEDVRGGGGGVAAAATPTSTAQTLTAKLTGPATAIAPGAVGTATVEIQNRGSIVDEVAIEVVDLPPGWASLTRPLITLLPNARDEVVVTLSPPKGIEATAGDHSFGVAVRSSVHGTEVRPLGVLTVGSVAGFTLGMQPVRSTKDFTLSLENTGNAPAALTLAAHDDEGKLRFDFGTLNVDLRPGEKRTVPLRVKMPGAPKLGPEVVKTFRVDATGEGVSAKQTSTGQLRIKPKLEAFRLPVIALLVVGALAGGGVAYATQCEARGLPGCSKDNGNAAAEEDDDRGAATAETGTPGATASTTAGGAGQETATAEVTMTTETTVTTPAADPTTPAPPTTVVPGSLKFPKADIVLDPREDYVAVVTTTAGEFTIDLDVATAYNTANSFAFLAQKGFYDGMPFEPLGASVEHGDPEGDGTGNAGYLQEVEFSRGRNREGSVGMVPYPKDPKLVGSEWYVNLRDNLFFDTGGIAGISRPVFGFVVDGLDVARRLTEKDTIEQIAIFRK